MTPTEIGGLYYEKCILIVRELEEADNLAALQQSQTRGTLRISTSVAFGRRVMVPLMIGFMREYSALQIDLSFDDRYVNLVEQGVDLAIRMGQLADSSLGASYLGVNPLGAGRLAGLSGGARHAGPSGRTGRGTRR